ncbi:hypothetical protein VTK56DRAFT_8420 [Thermocarpiscus australiensis]
MLVRPGAVRRTLPVRRLLASSALQCPSICVRIDSQPPPAGTRRVLTTTRDIRPWKRKSFRALAGFERTLATALEEHRFGDEIPFEGLPNGLTPPYPSGNSRSPLYELRPFDASSPLVIGEPAPYPRRSRMNVYGVPGDLEEMLSVFEACVDVGRLDRAALVLKRFDTMDILAPEDLMELHNRYLEARATQIVAEQDPDKAEDVHKWFEMQIQSKNLPFTADTIAYMLKTTIATSSGPRLNSLVNRYLSMLPEQGAFLGDVLSPNELAVIAQICPAYNIPENVPELSDAEAVSVGGPEDPGDHDGQSHPRKVSTSAPEVLSTPQKGMGLKSLKSTLSLFSELPAGFDIASLPLAQRREIQSRLEKDCVDAAVARWRDENENLSRMGLNPQISAPSLNSKLYDWHRALEARLAQEQAKLQISESAPKKSKEDLDRCVYGPHLQQSSPGRLSAVTILSVLGLLAMHGADKGVPLSNMVQQVAKIAEEDIRFQMQNRSLPKAKAKAKAKTRNRNARQLIRQSDSATAQSAAATPTAPAKGVSLVADPAVGSLEARWPLAIRAKIGAVLLSALIDSARVTVVREHPETKQLVSQSQPAFTHSVQLRKGRKVGVISPNRALVELMKREPRGEMLARHLPMVVEPEPWTKFDKGGFIEFPTPLVRMKNNEKDQRIYAEAAIERGDMEQMMKGLDVLGRTAWKINRPVFDVMLEAWNSGEELANIPALDPKIPIPPEPESTEDPMQRRLWLRQLKAVENEKSGLHSVRCFMNFQLEIARAFRDQTFYFPHNIDFRGRAYPVPTYLNHMGADHMRGLLIFAKGKPLGPSGLRWLKVHLANVYGFDKASLKEREDFATNNLENILDSAENPLTGKRWWLEAEDPWQCLATCFELKAALQSPDPAAFVSHLPVHQDGTCNGLQHYAALGGDTWGAQQVNLLPGDRPADVYSAVAELVQKQVTKDLEAGNDFAKAVDGKITRKVVKQTVMTNVYGVTFVGAKKQVQKQLDALYPDLSKTSGIDSSILASYISSHIFVALSTMFRGAHDIQHWLGEIGGRVCRAMTPEQLQRFAEEFGEVASKKGKAGARSKEARSKETRSKEARSKDEEVAAQFRSTLVWTTPLRMPVVQPYRKSGTRVISTCLQDLMLTNTERDDPVNRRKQLQAFPPNFIHSLDASHMMLSALECNERGLTFAAVHDSFWTHAADVDIMNDVIRDAFIRIHSEDVIGRLKAEFEVRYKGSIYRAKLDNSSDVARKIVEHRKKHRLSAKEELLQEMRRQELLRSMDPEEVRQGREMVTPASIFEAMATPDMLENEVEPEDLRPALDDELEGEAPLPRGSDDALELDEGGSLEASSDIDGGAGSETALSEDSDAANRLGDISSHLEALNGSNYFVMEMNKNFRRQNPKRPQGKVSLWLPLTFPDIPKKGDFDVRQLKESKYFFS